MERCTWCGNDPLYTKYHDEEWGVPVYDDKKLFEFLILETFQAGLSWITILRKRKDFVAAFDFFDYEKVANYSDEKFNELFENKGIVRNKLKIKAAITNAQMFIKVKEEYETFSSYIWSFTNHQIIKNSWENNSQIPSSTSLSQVISKDLKKKGFKFVGETVVYAFMQAIGMVNDHTINCFRYKEINE